MREYFFKIFLIVLVSMSSCSVQSMVPLHIDRISSSQLSHKALKSLSAISPVCEKLRRKKQAETIDSALTDQQVAFVERYLVTDCVHSHETLLDCLAQKLVCTFDCWLTAKHIMNALAITNSEIDRKITTELVFAALYHPEKIFALNDHDYQMVSTLVTADQYQDCCRIHSDEFGLQQLYQKFPIEPNAVPDYNYTKPVVDIHTEYVDLCRAKKPTVFSVVKNAVGSVMSQNRGQASTQTKEVVDRTRPPLVRIPTEDKAVDVRIEKTMGIIALLHTNAVTIHTPDGKTSIARYELERPAQWLRWISETVVAVVGNDFLELWNYADGTHKSFICSGHLYCTTTTNSLCFIYDNQLHCVDLASFDCTSIAVDEPDYAPVNVHKNNRLLSVGRSVVDLEQARVIFTLKNSASSDLSNKISLIRHFGFSQDGATFFYVEKTDDNRQQLISYNTHTKHKTVLMHCGRYSSWAFSSHGFFASFDTEGIRIFRITAYDMQLICHPTKSNLQLEHVGAYFDDNEPILFTWVLQNKYWEKWDFTDACAIADAWQQVNTMQKWVVYAVMKNPQGLVLTRDVLNLLLTLPPVIQKAVTQQFYRSSLISWAVLRAAQKLKGL